MQSRSRPAALAIALLAVTSGAAAEPTAADRALATELFDEGRARMAEGKYAEACPKLEESQRLDPGGGTLLNLATCHELEGRTASAWTEFTEALAIAERDGQRERVSLAESHIAGLAPRLSRVVILVPAGADRPDLVIRRDGTVVARAAWGTPMPVDPGGHRIEASAPGAVGWSARVEVGADGDRREVVVPALETAPAARPVAAPAPGPPTPRQDRSAHATPARVQTIAGWTLTGLGAVALGVGIGAGVTTISKDGESDQLCKGRCTDEGYRLNQSAKTAADVATVLFVSGAAAIGAGVLLLLTSRAAPARAPHAALRF